MNRYNIALLPVDPAFAATCAAFADENFAKQAEGFLLGAHALPHVTLCQFKADAAVLEQLWGDIGGAVGNNIELKLTGLNFRPGKEEHAGFTWVALSIAANEALQKMQLAVVKLVAKQKLQPLTGTGEEYFPHLTLARLRGAPEAPPAGAIKKAALAAQPFCLTLGLVDENGVYLKKLY